MLTALIKYYFINLSSTYIALKLSNTPITIQFKKCILPFLPLLSTLLTYFLNLDTTKLIHIVYILILYIFMSFITNTIKAAYIISLVSYVISYSIFAISSSLALIILFPPYFRNGSVNYLTLATFTTLFQIIFSVYLFKIKRFQKGMPFLFSKSIINIATFISILIISFVIFSSYNNTTSFPHRFISLALFATTLTILIHWWQAQITKSYKQALIQRELESLRTELAEKDRLLSHLTQQNEELGRLIHHDNKRIPAMEHAVCEYLTTDFPDSKTAIAKGNSLLLEITELAQNRNNSIAQIYAQSSKHHNTGISSLDTMLNFYEKRTSQEGIAFTVNFAADLHNLIPQTIEMDDFTHVLSDLLENAMIAAKQADKPTVQLQFYISQKYFVLEIADNGIPFETISLINYGITPLTTHADTGGSGIGLMDIWKIKEKYRASLHIAEYENNAPYTKKIALIFDKKHRYSISSYRKDELLQISKRTDLQIF